VVWRKSRWVDTNLIPDSLCVPLNQITNLTAQVAADGTLKWDAPAGHWTILRVGHTPTGHENETGGGGRGLECDKFNPAAARVQFDGWFGATIRQVGPELAGRVLKIFHVDSWEAGSQNWSPVFRGEFVKRRGYDPTAYLPAFAGVPVGSGEASERFLFDVRQTIAELVADNFFGTMAGLAHEHGCEFSAECVAPTMMSDDLLHYDQVDVPMGEFWLRSPTHDKPNDVQDAVSAAHIYGKKIAQAEAFTELRLQWDEQPAMLKALGDHNLCVGINRLVLHVFMENPWTNRIPGVTLGGVGTFLQRDQTWWDMVGGWIDYLSRCEAMLQQGRPVADVLYFTGEELPNRAILPTRYDPPLPSGYAADSINRDALLRLATVKHGRIDLPGGASYAVLVLPKLAIMTPEVLVKLRELATQGARIYGPPPEFSASWAELPGNDEVFDSLVAGVWGKGLAGTNTILKTMLQEQGVGPDLMAPEEVEWTHRSAESGEIYFVSNQRDEARVVQVSLRGAGKNLGVYNPVTGEIAVPDQVVRTNNRTVASLSLPAHGSAFVVASGGKSHAEPLPQAESAREIAGEWKVSFDPALSGWSQPAEFSELASWTTREEPGIHFYSGTAVYAKTFTWDKPIPKGRYWLDLGSLADLATVTLNGKDCGTAWTPPYRVEITGALQRGENKLVIRVANTWNNRLVGDRGLPAAQRKTWTNAADRPEKAGLLPAGLLGPVKVMFAE